MTKKKIKKKVKKKTNECKIDKCNVSNYNPCGNAFYGLGFIGALIYYTLTANSFWLGILGILKSFIWPVFLVYEVLKFLGA